MLLKEPASNRFPRSITLAFRLVAAAMCVAFAAEGQSMPELALGLHGRVRSTEGLGTEQLALVELEWSAPTRSAAAIPVALSDVDPDLEPAMGAEVPLDPLERDESPGAGSASSRQRRVREEPSKGQAVRKEIPYVLTPIYVREAVHAALSAQGIAAALGRLDSLASRARTSATLPEIRVRAGRDVDQSLRLTPTSDDPYRYSQTGGVTFVVDGSVTWRLGRLLFASEELSVERLRLAQARERQRVTIATMSELLSWQNAWRRLAADGFNVNAADDLAETTVRLDLMTDGWFSAHQPASGPDGLSGQPAHAAPRATRGVPLLPTARPTVAAGRERMPPSPRDPGKNQETKVDVAQMSPAGLERLALSR